MDVQITGKAIDLGNALQVHVREKLETGVQKYFDRSADAQVIFDKDGKAFDVEITLHLASGVFLSTSARDHEVYAAFDSAMTKLEKRLRRHRSRLKSHHNANREPLPAEAISAYVLAGALNGEAETEDAAEDDLVTEEEHGDAPVVVAERPAVLRRMSVSDAVLQLDVSDEQVVLFRNAKHGDLNVVYRRDDGNIGWIDGAARS